MSNVVSEWLIYSKSSSVPKVDVMTQFELPGTEAFLLLMKVCVSGSRGWACRDRGSRKPVCQLIHIQIDDLSSSPLHLRLL